MEKYIYNPDYKGEKTTPEIDLGSGTISSLVFGSPAFFEALKVACNVKDNEEIIGVRITETAINVIFRNK